MRRALAFLLLIACSARGGAPVASQDDCKEARRSHCEYSCIEKHDPPQRPQCEVDCMDRPESYWDGKIPECTQRLQ
jgi:hypothetical protein